MDAKEKQNDANEANELFGFMDAKVMVFIQTTKFFNKKVVAITDFCIKMVVTVTDFCRKMVVTVTDLPIWEVHWTPPKQALPC